MLTGIDWHQAVEVKRHDLAHFALVQPNALALRALIYFNEALKRLAKWNVAIWAAA